MGKTLHLLSLISLIATAGCGRGVDLKPENPSTSDNRGVRKEASDAKADAKSASDGASQDANIKELREAAEKLEKAAQEFNQISSAYSEKMMFAALAWQKAGDKSRALAAAKS